MDQSKTSISTVWNGDRSGQGTIESGSLNAPIAIPQAFGGTGAGTEPKELLLASASACFTMTLVGLLEARKLPAARLAMNSEVSISPEGIMKMIHRPELVLPDGTPDESMQLAERTFEAADRQCSVGNLLKKAGVEIGIEGRVSAGAGAL
ncbi:OsmC family protein [Saccharibacillus brassicae]|nr:OsmC family protein [Saccharibacillus brassicae]